MIKVQRHGRSFAVKNPATGKETDMINIVFVEEGRKGANSSLSGSSNFLSSVIGEDIGLEQTRTHTHPVLLKAIGKFPVNKEFPGHINRELHSIPQMRQQEGIEARAIDGRPTYFKTWIEEKAVDDVDKRMSNELLLSVSPALVFNARAGGAEVRILSEAAELNLDQLVETA